MLRSGAPTRSLLRSLNTARTPTSKVHFQRQFTSQLCAATKRPSALAIAKPLALQIRVQSTVDKLKSALPSVEEQKQIAKEKLQPHPDIVSSSSSTHPIFSEVATPEEEKDTDMMAGVKADMRTIQETFSMHDVPREAYYIGMAGVLPYVATSLSTSYCAFEINHAVAHGTGFFISEKTAELALHILEPLQIGYGAVIISFLGAIHWGLEFAGYQGYHGYSRYMIGVIAPAIAWPTVLLPVEYALITQFLAFNFLYYTDSRASRRGLAPPWYGVYRFVLTFIVGGAIVVSLIGRGQIAGNIGKTPTVADRITALREGQAQALEDEEKARRTRIAKDEEDEDEDEE